MPTKKTTPRRTTKKAPAKKAATTTTTKKSPRRTKKAEPAKKATATKEPAATGAGKGLAGVRRTKNMAYVAGEVLRDMGLEKGITDDIKKEFAKRTADMRRGKGEPAEWYLYYAWNMVCGFQGEHPAE